MPTAPLTVSVARSFDDFLAMAPAWEALHARAERPLPFLRHGWLKLSWELRRRRPFEQFCAIIVHELGEPVMAAAFVSFWHRLRPEVRFLGSGTPQYSDALWAVSERTDAHADGLLEALAVEKGMPNRLRVLDWPAGSRFRAIAGRRSSVIYSERQVSQLDLGPFGDWQDYRASLSKNLRGDHGRQLRRLERQSALAFTVETAEARRHVLHWLMASKLDWLARSGRKADWLRDGSGERFFVMLLDEPNAPESLVVTLRLDGRILAAALAFRQGSSLYISKLAHDPTLETYSPGRTLIMFLIELAFSRGITLVDLMTGTPAWKRRFLTGKSAIVSQRVRLK